MKRREAQGLHQEGLPDPLPPLTPEALAPCAPASKSPPSFLSHPPQRAPIGSSKLSEFTLFSFKEPEFLLGTRQLKFNLPFLLLGN